MRLLLGAAAPGVAMHMHARPLGRRAAAPEQQYDRMLMLDTHHHNAL